MDEISRLFKDRQDELLLIANSKIGRFLLRATKPFQIVKVGHSDIIYHTGNWIKKGKFYVPELVGEFWAGHNRNFSLLAPSINAIDYLREEMPRYMPLGTDEYLKAIEHYSGEGDKYNYPLIYLDGPTAFEAATGGTGGIYALHATYATARSAASASGAEQAAKNEFVGGNYEIGRWFCPTDFTAIVAGSDVTAASASIWPTGRNTTVDDTAKFILTTQAATDAVANDDFNNLTLDSPTTYGTTAAFSAVTLNEYNLVTMDAGFQTLVEVGAGGFIKMGMRATKDIDATAPAGRNYMTMSQANSERTKFTITWTPPAAAGGIPSYKSLLGVGV